MCQTHIQVYLILLLHSWLLLLLFCYVCVLFYMFNSMNFSVCLDHRLCSSASSSLFCLISIWCFIWFISCISVYLFRLISSFSHMQIARTFATDFGRKRAHWIRSNDFYSPSNLQCVNTCARVHSVYVRNIAANSHNFTWQYFQKHFELLQIK